MRIVDYQSGTELRDVSLELTEEELNDLEMFVRRMRTNPRLNRTFLTQVSTAGLEREFTVAVTNRLDVAIA